MVELEGFGTSPRRGRCVVFSEKLLNSYGVPRHTRV